MTDVSLNIVPATAVQFELRTRRSKLDERGVEEILREESREERLQRIRLRININEENIIIRSNVRHIFSSILAKLFVVSSLMKKKKSNK